MRAESAETLRPNWHAELALGYAQSEGRTVLARRHHVGPLAVQKSLYPEGDAVCHNFILHPPAGIVGGDELRINVQLDAATHAVLTTPGAAKWYRSAGQTAHQRIGIEISAGATLEWLPQETIYFPGAHAALDTTITLRGTARYLGWDIACFGRPAAGEAFDRGSVRQRMELRRDDKLLWSEQGRIDGNDPLFAAAVGFGGATVTGTLVAAGAPIASELIAALRGIEALQGRVAVTALEDVLLMRYLGDSTEDARNAFAAARAHLRPALCGLPDHPLRIWRT